MDSFINLIKKYKWLTIPLIPLVLFFVLIILLLFSPSKDEVNTTLPTPPIPTTEAQAIEPTISLLLEQGHDPEIEEPLEIREDFQKREPATGTFSDGTAIYSFTSTNPDRPNAIITLGGDLILLQRNVTDPAYPVVISDYTDADGPPEKLVQGSRFYGSDKQIYIYGASGVAFIADPTTQQVLEQHIFIPMNADAYLKKFGQQ